MANTNKKGEISLSGIFQNEANQLVSAVEQGRILHQTKNIRDSGTPLEEAVRSFFSRYLPQAYTVQHGYLYDPDSNCSPQLDIFVSRTQRTTTALSTPEGAQYSPFTDAFAIGEIKTTGANIDKHLKQLAKRVRLIGNMREAMRAKMFGSPPSVFSFLIVAKSDNIDTSKIAEAWMKSDSEFPDFILFVDTGQIVLPPSEYKVLFEQNDLVDPQSRSNSDNLAIFEPKSSRIDMKSGEALQWFFYAVLHRLNLREKHILLTAFKELSVSDDTLAGGVEAAAKMLSGTSDPFAKAMIRGKVHLRRIEELTQD